MGSRSIMARAEQQAYFVAAAGAAVGGSLVPVPGGVLVRDSDGELIGAVGDLRGHLRPRRDRRGRRHRGRRPRRRSPTDPTDPPPVAGRHAAPSHHPRGPLRRAQRSVSASRAVRLSQPSGPSLRAGRLVSVNRGVGPVHLDLVLAGTEDATRCGRPRRRRRGPEQGLRRRAWSAPGLGRDCVVVPAPPSPQRGPLTGPRCDDGREAHPPRCSPASGRVRLRLPAGAGGGATCPYGPARRSWRARWRRGRPCGCAPSPV